MAKEGGFYIGRDFDPQAGERTIQNTNYDPDDLTTHAVVVDGRSSFERPAGADDRP
jgi:hypothetical protein